MKPLEVIMKKSTAKKLAEVLLEVYAEAHTENTKNYPLRGMLSQMINKTSWLPEAKLNDAAQHTATVQALISESIAQESDISGKITMQPTATSVVGSPHYDEYKVQQHMRYAERDEFEAGLHVAWHQVMQQAFTELTGEKFVPKQQRKTTKPNVGEWLAKRTA
jgi:hypothetical protein